MDLRGRVAAACDDGQGTTAVARRFEGSPAWARRLKRHRRERGDREPRRGGHALRKPDRDRLAELHAQRPDATPAELRQLLGGVAGEAGWTGPGQAGVHG